MRYLEARHFMSGFFYMQKTSTKGDNCFNLKGRSIFSYKFIYLPIKILV